MATVLLFHHAMGPTPAFLAFAEALRDAGHTVHTPDLFEGRTFGSIAEGMAHVETLGFATILARGVATAEGLPADLVYAGFSLGVVPAQKLAQTRPGARGGLFYYSCVPVEMLGAPWPRGLPAEIHMKEEDPWGEEDRPAARALADAEPAVEFYLYPVAGHYFAETGFADYDPPAAALLLERSLRFLARAAP